MAQSSQRRHYLHDYDDDDDEDEALRSEMMLWVR
jgi:hypothetical protein